MAWYEKLDELSDSLIKLDQKLGIKKIIQYLMLLLIVVGIINIRSILKWGVEFISGLNDEVHAEKMERRDQLLAELVPELHELLGSTDADRVLYFEYHNTKENVVGIPFKYIDLVLQSSRYGVPLAPMTKFKDINIGNLTPLYEDIKSKKIIPCLVSNVEDFQIKYPGNHEFLSENDGSVQQVFIIIPGIRQPIGMIVLEWTNEDEADLSRVYKKATEMITTINGLILRYM